jgi:sodium/potassium-transporting ATPase subunit alpha
MTLTDCTIGSENLTTAAAKERLDSLRAENSSASGNLISQLGALAALCNAAELDAANTDIPLAKRKIFGDATDSAVLRFSEGLVDGNVAYFRACWQRMFELAFNSKNKFMIRCFSLTRPEALGHTLSRDEAERFTKSDT